MKALKITLYIMLTLTILASFSFVSIKLMSHAGREDNWFNSNIRPKFNQNLTLRKMFSLYSWGDAWSDYLTQKNFKQIIIEYDSIGECEIPDDTLREFTYIVDKYSNKNSLARLVKSDKIKIQKDSLSWEDIMDIEGQYRDYHSAGDTVVLYVMCLSSFQEQPGNIGITYNHDGIVIFDKTIKEIVGKNERLAVRLLQLSTLIHEFGHQIGLNHVAPEHCVMNEIFEAPRLDSLLYINDFPADFCQESLAEMNLIKNRR